MSPTSEPRAPRITPTRGGVAFAVVGALLLGVGLFQATSASTGPACPSGTSLLSSFGVSGADYTFIEPAGNESVVSLGATTSSGADWSSSTPVAAIVVKGGPGSKDVWITQTSTSGSFDAAGLGGATPPSIQSVQFCRAAVVDPAAPASGFNVVTRGDASLLANESEGPVAIGGDLEFDQYQVAIHSAGTFRVDPSDAEPTALLVGGRLSVASSAGQVSVDKGWLAIGDGTDVTAKRQNPNQVTVNATNAGPNDTPRAFGQNSFQTLPSAIRSSSFDFAGVFRGWSELADGLAACPATVQLAGANGPTAPWTGGDAYLYDSGPGQRVLSLSAAQLSALSSITFRDGATPAADRPLILHVTGVPANWNPPKLTGDSNTIARYVLWNFHDLEQVTITGGNELAGTVLLPSGALVQQGGGNLVGGIYADTFVHGGGAEVHANLFATTVTPCSVPQPSTTTTAPSTTTTQASTTVPSTTVPSTSTTEATTTTTEATTTTEPTTTSEATTTTAEVAGSTVVASSITPDDDARVAGTSTTRGLAFTGSSSLPLTVSGALFLFAGLTMVLVGRERGRHRRS